MSSMGGCETSSPLGDGIECLFPNVTGYGVCRLREAVRL